MIKTKPSHVAKAPAPATPEFYSSDSDLLGPSKNLGILIKQVHNSLNRMIALHVSPLGLTAMQWRPMVMIRYSGVNTPAELSRRAHVDSGAMTRTLDRLEAKKFVTRQRCEDDRRVVRLALTETGEDVADQILPAVAATLNAHLQGFDAHEVKTLTSLLQRMLTNGEYVDDSCGENE